MLHNPEGLPALAHSFQKREACLHILAMMACMNVSGKASVDGENPAGPSAPQPQETWWWIMLKLETIC